MRSRGRMANSRRQILISTIKCLCTSRRILLSLFIVAVLASGVPAHALTAFFQAGQGQFPGSLGDPQTQRNQQYDQLQQIQQQQQALRDLDVTQRSMDLERLSYVIWAIESE